MAKNKDNVSIDITCIKTDVQNVMIQGGCRILATAIYKGDISVEDNIVSVQVKITASDEDILEQVVPFVAGATRQMDLTLTNEDLGNHVEI